MLAVIGIIITLLGTLFMAFELFFTFSGNVYGGVMAGNSTGFVYPTDEFTSWEHRKKKCMFIGIILICSGTSLQVWAVVAQGGLANSDARDKSTLHVSLPASTVFFREDYHFDTKITGVNKVTFGEGYVVLTFASHKINTHQLGSEFELKDNNGSADLCFIVKEPAESLIQYLAIMNIALIKGPVNRTDAVSKIVPAYFRVPDCSGQVKLATDL